MDGGSQIHFGVGWDRDAGWRHEHRVLASKEHSCCSCRGAEGENWDRQSLGLSGQHLQALGDDVCSVESSRTSREILWDMVVMPWER